MTRKRWSAFKPRAMDPTPLYLQVARKLSEAIRAGEWQPEEALPPERELSEMLGISRVTARKALGELAQENLIQKRQGSGTFIAPRLEEPLSRLTGLTERLTSKGFVSSSRWLERRIDRASTDDVMKLGVSPSSQVARLERLRLADGVVVALERSALPVKYVPDPNAVERSLYTYLEGRGHKVVRALQHFRAVNASKRIASLVGLRARDAILLVTRIGFTKDDVAIELTDTYCKSEYYDFVAELRR